MNFLVFLSWIFQTLVVTASTAQWDIIVSNADMYYLGPYYGTMKAMNGGFFFGANSNASSVSMPYLTSISSYLEIESNPLLQKIELPSVC